MSIDFQLILQTLTLVAGVVWAVSAIKSTTEVLRSSIVSLEKTVEKLNNIVDRMASIQNIHETRISMLERENNKGVKI